MQEVYKGTYHRYIYEKLLRKCQKELRYVVKREDVMRLLWGQKIPVELRQKFLEEMVHFKLIRFINKQNIKILR